MAKGKKTNSYLKKAANFATGQGKQRKGDKSGTGREQTQQEKDSSLQRSSAESDKQYNTAISTAVVGLNNLGNTCFFNGSVQLLLACSPLQQILEQPEHCISKGPLGFALQQAAKFASGHQQGSSSKNSNVYNPQSLLSAVCCHAPVFKGKQQHDSHELMRMLLDGLQVQEQRYKRELAKLEGGSSSNTPDQQQQDLPDSSAIDAIEQHSSDTSDSSSHSSSGDPAAAGRPPVNTATPPALTAAENDAGSRRSSETASAFDADGGSGGSVRGTQPHGNSFAALGYGTDVTDVDRSMDSSFDSVAAGTASGSAGQHLRESPDAVLQEQQQHQENQIEQQQVAVGGMEGSAEGQDQRAGAVIGPLAPAATTAAFAAAAAVQPGGYPEGCAACGARLQESQQQQQRQMTDQQPDWQQQQQEGQPVGPTAPLQQQHHHQQGLSRKSLLPPEPPTAAGTTTIDKVFGGVLVSTITCTACGYVSVSYEPFLDLSLPIPLPTGSGLQKKGSLLARLAGRSSAGGKKKGKTAAATESAAAAAPGEAAGQQDQAAADAAVALEADGQPAAAAAGGTQGKKLSKKQQRKIQQDRKKAEIAAKKLARQAAKQQQQSSDEDLDQQQQQQPEADQQQQSDGEVAVRGAADSQQQQQRPQGDVPQQQQQSSPGSVHAAAAAACVSPAVANGRVGGDSDADSAIGGWADLTNAALPASPPTHLVSCWGASWDAISPKPPTPTPGSSSSALKPTHRRFSSLGSLSALTSSAKGGLTSLFGWQGRSSRDGSVHEGLNLSVGTGNSNSKERLNLATNGGISSFEGSKRGVSPPPRPASALGIVSVGERFGLGRISSSSGDGTAAAPAPAAAPAAGSKANGMNGQKGPSSSSMNGLDRHSSSSDTSNSSSSSNASVKVTDLAAAIAGPLSAAASADYVLISNNSSTHSSNSSRYLGPTIPEDGPVTMTPSMVLTDTQRSIIKQHLAIGVLSNGNDSDEAVCDRVDHPAAAAAAAVHLQFEKQGLPDQQQQQLHSNGLPAATAAVAAAAAADESPFQQQASYFGLPSGLINSLDHQQQQQQLDAVADQLANGHPEQQQQHQAYRQPSLHRAYSDDAVVRQRYSSTGGSSSRISVADATVITNTTGDASSSSTSDQVEGANGIKAGVPCDSQRCALDPAAAAAAVRDTEAVASATATNSEPSLPAAASSAIDGGPFAAAAAQAVVPGAAAATPADPFAAAAVAGSKDSVAVSHCLASFFVREEITWDCPKEKVLWRERRVSLNSPAAAAAAAVGVYCLMAGQGVSSPRPVNSVCGAVEPSGASSPLLLASAAGTADSVLSAAAAAAGVMHSQPMAICNRSEAAAASSDDDVNELDGPIYKQVSFSDKNPEIIFIPSSIEQRGTDLAAALVGSKPFYRPVTWSGASLLLTAQMKQLSDLVIARSATPAAAAGSSNVIGAICDVDRSKRSDLACSVLMHAGDAAGMPAATSSKAATAATAAAGALLGPIAQRTRSRTSAAAAATASTSSGSSSNAYSKGASVYGAPAEAQPRQRDEQQQQQQGLEDLQLDQSDHEHVIFRRVLALGLKAAGEGGVPNAAAVKLLPGGRPVSLGELVLPDMEGISGDHQASLVQSWVHLALNCMADLITHEGGISGLQDMLSGGVTLVSCNSESAAGAEDRGWRIWGRLPAGKTAAAAAGVDATAEGSSGSSNVAAAAAGGFWQYPSDCDTDSDRLANGSGSSRSSRTISPVAHVLSQQQQQQPQVLSRLSPSQQLLQRQHHEQQQQAFHQQQQQSLLAEDDMFLMDEDQDQQQQRQQCEQDDQGILAQPVQAWEADADSDHRSDSSDSPAAAAAADDDDSGVERYVASEQEQQHQNRANEVGCKDRSLDSSDSNSGSVLARQAQEQPQQQADSKLQSLQNFDDLGRSSRDSSSTSSSDTSCSTRTKPMNIVVPPSQSPAAGEEPSTPTTSSSIDRQQRNSSALPAPSPAAAAVGTPSSLKSSLKRRSATFSKPALKAYRIHIAPPVLMLHLKRFQHDGRGRLNKLDTQVKFDFELDLAQFMAPAAAAAAAGSKQAAAGAGLDRSSSNSSVGESRSLLYDLVGVVVHMGTMRSGHYVAYVKRQPQQQQRAAAGATGSSSTTEGSNDTSIRPAITAAAGSSTSSSTSMFSSLVGGGRSSAAAAAAAKAQWYYVSDSIVKAVSKSEVAAAQAYMLMYVRRDAEDISSSTAAAAEATAAAAAVVPEQQQQQQQQPEGDQPTDASGEESSC